MIQQKDLDFVPVLRFTEDIFGGKASITVDSDPETDQNSFVVQVATTAEVADIVRLNDKWHRKLVEVTGKSANVFRLSLDIT